MPRCLPRTIVALTVLVCLGAGGYAGQVWWAKRGASKVVAFLTSIKPTETEKLLANTDWALTIQKEWDAIPWYGRLDTNGINLRKITDKNVSGNQTYATGIGPDQGRWYPRRLCLEVLNALTGESLPCDSDACKSWFKAHPNLVWDEKKHRLVDAPPSPR